ERALVGEIEAAISITDLSVLRTDIGILVQADVRHLAAHRGLGLPYRVASTRRTVLRDNNQLCMRKHIRLRRMNYGWFGTRQFTRRALKRRAAQLTKSRA